MRPSTIFVVEDHSATLSFYTDLLIDGGYHVVTATSGQAALARVTAQPIDGVILDYRLPDMSGVEVCQQLRAIVAATVPILIITADRPPGLEADARAAGATSFLEKPIDIADLLGQLGALLP